MDKAFEAEYWVPEHVREYSRSLGFVLPLESMEGHIRVWHDWMSLVSCFIARGDLPPGGGINGTTDASSLAVGRFSHCQTATRLA